MSPRDFVYWLNGYLELSGSNTLTEAQVQTIKTHLALVFTQVTPVIDPLYPNYPGTGEPFPQFPGVTYCQSKNIPRNESERLC